MEAANNGLISKLGSTTAPIGATCLLTFMTFFVYLVTLPLLIYLYKRWGLTGKPIGRRLFLFGLVVGGSWGLLLEQVGSAFVFLGPLSGAVAGLFLATTLGRSTREL